MPAYSPKIKNFLKRKRENRSVRLERLLIIAFYQLDNEVIKREILREFEGRKNAGSGFLGTPYMRKKLRTEGPTA